MSFQHFFEMSGYAFYVWTAYVFVFVVLFGNGVVAWKKQITSRKKKGIKKQ